MRLARALLAPVATTAVGVVAACGGGPSLYPSEDAPAPPPTAPDSFRVAFSTTEGSFHVVARRHWSPAGVDRFWDLVRRGYFDGNVVFRVVEGYVAQFGIHPEPEVNEAWEDTGIPDEPVRVPNERGTVSFARGGPESRSVQLFINLEDNTPRLDTLTYLDVSGFPPIGEVVEGMEAVDAFEDRWGNEPSQRQDSIATQGPEWLDERFPGLARIVEAEVVESWD